MDLREEFVLRAKTHGANVSALCREYGVSRKTGHKWIARFEEGGVEALKDLSRRPHRPVHGTDGETVLKVIEARHAHPRWGPKKLRAVLFRSGWKRVPTVRTVARILERAGEPLIRPRRRKAASTANQEAPRVKAEACNALWTVDFKGWWRTRDGKRCEPLTVRDAFTRFILCAKLMGSTRTEPVKQVFECLFEQYGLPDSIQVDNGPPFASTKARAGLTRLSAWWISLGIRVIRGRPGCPQDNGGHERMHGDMSLDLELFPADGAEAQQHDIDRWVEEFNHVRPHEALGMQVPAELYRSSQQRYRGPLRACYPPEMQLRRVNANGSIRVDGNLLFLGTGLSAQDVAIERLEDDCLRVQYYTLNLGRFVSAHGRWTDAAV